MDKEQADQKEVQRILKAKDLYHVLSVSDDCVDQEVLTSCYKSISTKVHPVLNKDENAEEAFKRVSHAYQVLKDDEKRKQYNLLLEKSSKNKKNKKDNNIENDEEEDDTDPYELYLQFNPDPSHKITISEILNYLFFGLVVLQFFFDFNPLHLFNRFFFNPLTRDEVRSVISFEQLPNYIEFESNKGIQYFVPIYWIEKVAQKTGLADEESISPMRDIADQIYTEILQEKCELEKNELGNDNGHECEKYYSFIR